jgi:hypothetical protein
VAAFLGWLEANWFNLVQTGALLLGLVYTGLGFARDSKGRRLSNLLALKAEHRELWNALHDRPELARVLDSDLDLLASPMTNQEEVFLRQMIVHFALAWELARNGVPLDTEAFRYDVREVFSFPLPKLAWGRAVQAQDPGFSRFVADAMKSREVRGDD